MRAGYKFVVLRGGLQRSGGLVRHGGRVERRYELRFRILGSTNQVRAKMRAKMRMLLW